MNKGLLDMVDLSPQGPICHRHHKSEDIAGKSERAELTADLSPSLFKPKLKPPPTSAPFSLTKSKPPHLNLSFSKPRSKPYPKNYNLNLKRKRNERKQRGRERSFSVWLERERDRKMKMSLSLSFVFIDDVVFGWHENLRKIEIVTTTFFS